MDYFDKNLENFLTSEYEKAERRASVNDKLYTHSWYKHIEKQNQEIRELVSVIDRVFHQNNKLVNKYMSSTISIIELERTIKCLYEDNLAKSLDALMESLGGEKECACNQIVVEALNKIATILDLKPGE